MKNIKVKHQQDLGLIWCGEEGDGGIEDNS